MLVQFGHVIVMLNILIFDDVTDSFYMIKFQLFSERVDRWCFPCVRRCWKTTITAALWTGGVWVWWCTRWCADGCPSITRITSACLSSSSWRTSAFLARSHRRPNLSCPACSRKTRNSGQSGIEQYSYSTMHCILDIWKFIPDMTIILHFLFKWLNDEIDSVHNGVL